MIPVELRELPNWVGCKIIDGRKIPINLATGNSAETNNPETWGTYEAAKGKKDSLDGIGFCFQAPYVGIDLDDCVVDGVINEFAKDIIRKVNSYTEFSISKTGIHIITKGELPKAFKNERIEVYQNGRYFITTGHIVHPLRPIRAISAETLEALVPVRNTQPRLDAAGSSWVKDALEGIQEGHGDKGRTPTFCRIIGYLKNKGIDQISVEAFLKPWAAQHSYSDRIGKLIDDQFRRYPAPVQTDSESSNISDFLEQIETVEWIVPGLISKQSIGFFCGLPETNKTWFLMDLAIEAARGGMWGERFPATRTKTMFINQERAKAETQRRFQALLKAKGLSPKDIRQDLLIKSNTTIRIDLQRSYDAFKKELLEQKPGLVIVDSFSTFHTKEEASNSENMVVLERIKELRDLVGCSFLFVDHESKVAYQRQKDAREPNMGDQSGASAKSRVAEVMFAAVNHGTNASMMYQTKATQGQKIEPFLVEVLDEDTNKEKIRVRAG